MADRLLATLKQLPLEHLSAFTQQFLIFCSNFVSFFVARKFSALLQFYMLTVLYSLCTYYITISSLQGMAQFALCEVSDIFNSLNGKQSER